MDWSKVIDEMCRCGHKRSEHNDTLARGHGNCKKCKCVKYTWTSFILKK